MSSFLEDESDKTPDLSAVKLLNSNMKWFERNLGHNLLVTTSVTHKMGKRERFGANPWVHGDQ